MSAGQSFSQALPYPIDVDSNEQSLASFLTEEFTPSNTATVVTLKNQIVPGFERVYKNGLRLASGTYTMKGKALTLSVPANGTDHYIVDYFFRASA